MLLLSRVEFMPAMESVTIVKKEVERLPQLLSSYHIQTVLHITEDKSYELMKAFPVVMVMRRQYVLKRDFKKWLLNRSKTNCSG